MLGKNLIKAAAGNAGEVLGIEDVFSTWLYTGNGSTQTITNGIDLAGEGGLLWLKKRDNSAGHYLADTNRGNTKTLRTDSAGAESTNSVPINSFNSNGFTIGADSEINSIAGHKMTSWTFRKAPGFFDVVTYTGTGSARTIAHNLGSVPGVIIIKRTDSTGNWLVYHRSIGTAQHMFLDTVANTVNGDLWGAPPTSSVFSVRGNGYGVNDNGATYVAYLFAHDEQIFGESGDQSVIKCGSFTTDGSGDATVALGWEPQWVLMKKYSATGQSWLLLDSMRGTPLLGNSAYLSPNTAIAEFTDFGLLVKPNATGFTSTIVGESFSSYIYIAIRRGPMKKPTSGTEVFSVLTASNAQGTKNVTDFAVDLQWANAYQAGTGFYSMAKLAGVSTTGTTGGRFLSLSSANAEANGTLTQFWDNTGFQTPSFFAIAPTVYCSFRRAPGFFDVVAYTGTGSARTVSHNLGAVPELMLVKSRSANAYWRWYWAPLGATKNFYMPNDEASVTQTEIWNNTAPTSSAFTVGTSTDTNFSGRTYIAYLFATCPGVSKVGSYTGTGTTLNIDCGFTSGSRLVLIKRTDSTGDWYIWDTARGIVAANDPFLLLNSTAAENSSTDYIDPLSSGFQISSTAPAAINANGGSYIFLAIS